MRIYPDMTLHLWLEEPKISALGDVWNRQSKRLDLV